MLMTHMHSLDTIKYSLLVLDLTITLCWGSGESIWFGSMRGGKLLKRGVVNPSDKLYFQFQFTRSLHV